MKVILLTPAKERNAPGKPRSGRALAALLLLGCPIRVPLKGSIGV